MTQLDDLVPTLATLPRHDYIALLKKVDEQRRQQTAAELAEEPSPQMSKADFAAWIAQQHYAIDQGITRIIYLPAGSGPQDIRLLEVNHLASLPEEGPILAFDFLPDSAGLNFSLSVADLTPSQFDAIRANQLALPQGWSLTGAEEIPPLRK